MNDIIPQEEWTKLCPICNKIQKYRNEYNLKRSIRENRPCLSCGTKGKNTWMKGRPLSEETRDKISKSNKGKHNFHHTKEAKIKMSLAKIDYVPWIKGKHLSEETKQKIKEKRKLQIIRKGHYHPLFGKHLSEEMKNKQSKALTGRKYGKRSEETKKRMRISRCKWLQRLNIGTRDDEGAKEWFDKYNKKCKTHFQQNWYCESLGYYADGYDKEKHIWCEYDNKYHKQLKWKNKDLIRQNNIIKYFESIGNPLKQFIRILGYDNEKIETIYGDVSTTFTPTDQ